MPQPNRLAILREARRLLRNPTAWRQGDNRDPRTADDAAPPYCVGAALHTAAARLGADARALDKTERAFGRAIGADTGGDELTEAIVEWNDKRGRTHAEVLAALDAARTA